MTALPDTLAAQLARMLPMFSSDKQGDVVATAAAVTRRLRAEGCDWHDLAAHVVRPPETRVVYRDRPVPQRPPPRDYGDWRRAWQGGDPGRRQKAQVARVRAAPPGFMSPWEAEFAASLARQLDQGRTLSPRQGAILADLFARFEERFG